MASNARLPQGALGSEPLRAQQLQPTADSRFAIRGEVCVALGSPEGPPKATHLHLEFQRRTGAPWLLNLKKQNSPPKNTESAAPLRNCGPKLKREREREREREPAGGPGEGERSAGLGGQNHFIEMIVNFRRIQKFRMLT